MRSIPALTAATFLLGGLGGFTQERTAAPRDFEKNVRPVLSKYCFRCHGPEKQKAKLRLDALNPDLVGGPHAETWHEVLNQLNRGEMPPENEKAPTSEERRRIIAWLTGELARASEAKRGTGTGVALRRLTRYEYANTLRDLLGLDCDYAQDLPPEPSSRDGFRNNGASLGISALQVQTYLQIARNALDKAIVTGPKPEVHRTFAEKPAKAKRRKNAPTVSNELRPHYEFLVQVDRFPRIGDFRVRVVAEGLVPEGLPYPVMRVTIGLRADVKSPEKVLAEVEVAPSKKGPRRYEFTGRIEEFPLPGHNPKFPGLKVKITNVYDDGTYPKPGKQKRPKKKKGEKAAPPPRLKPAPVIKITSVEFQGPIFEAWPPKSHTAILFPKKPGTSERDYAREVAGRFMTRAYRRPATDADVAMAMAYYDATRQGAPSFEAAMKDVLAMILVSPNFLYLAEPLASGKTSPQPLTDYELASRLSYFLTSTMPDATLLDLASRGALRKPSVREAQVRRLLADPRSWEFVEHFTDQWLDLSGLDRVAVNPEYYPKFDDRLKKEMRLETQHFFARILRKDLSALNLLDSDFAMLNEPLARHYGIPGPKGRSFERVDLKPEDRRGGLLTQGSMLLTNSTGEDSHAIRRAVWILKRLLNDPPAPPPPDVPELESEKADFAKLPLKRQLELHRKKEACNDCHRGIDPWGIPLENFDAIGHWRTDVKRVVSRRRIEKSPVVADAELPGGHEVKGIEGLKAHLMNKEKARFSRALTEKLLAYSLGRSLGLGDQADVNRLADSFAKSGYTLSDLIVEIVKSAPFGSKQGSPIGKSGD